MVEPTLDWEGVLRAAAEFQGIVPKTALTGGTAASMHPGHRFSRDADHLLPDLRERFAELVAFLEGRDEWTTARVEAPNLILGDFLGVETGLRQLRRSAPLETTSIATASGPVVVPTPEEMLRIKGWLILSRNATRDYVDFAALASLLKADGSKQAMSTFDRCYRDIYRPAKGRDVSPHLQLARQLAAPAPKDLAGIDMANYRGIVPPWDKWEHIAAQCRAAAVWVADAGLAP